MTRARILFVDDEAYVLDGISRALRRERHRWEVITANGGPAALRALAEAHFDVVVSDLRMPEVDGLEVLAHVQRTAPSTIRVMLSGSADDAEADTSGLIEHLLCKPCDTTTLRQTIERVLAERGTAQE